MPIIKTTLNVESTNASAAPIKLTSTINNDLTDNVTMGQVTINSNSFTEINPESNGAKGSYLYVKSSATNPKHTAITISADEGVQPITLFAGEYALIPLSADQAPLMAITSYGTAELEYFHGSRGEEIGESGLILYVNQASGNWEFFTMDASTGIPGPTVDTEIAYSAWSHDGTYVVNRKGYILYFNNSTTTSKKYIFINRRGVIVNEVTGVAPYNYTVWNGEGRANLLTWLDDGVGYAVHFDGDVWSEHEFNNIDNISVDNNWDDCTSDGTFPVYIEGYNGDSDIEALFFVRGGNKTLIKTTDFSSNEEHTNSYAYSYGNFIAVETFGYDDNDGVDYIDTLEIFNTDGVLLKSVDFDNMPLDDWDLYFYGSGKMQVVYEDDDSGDYIFLNYNQLTGKLIGEDLQWRSDYSGYEVICESYSTGYSLNYRPESVAIISHGDYNIDNEYFLNQETDGDLKVTYIINNDLEPRNYVVPSTENDYYAGNSYNSGLYATDEDFILLSGDSQTSGPLVATRFTSGAEPTKFTLIQNLGDYYTNDQYDNDDADVNSRVFGDYRLLDIRKDTGNENRDLIVYSSKVLDTLSIVDWNSYDTSREFNTLIAVDYDVEKVWYFNTSTKKWVLLPTYTDGNYWNTESEGDQYPVSPGKILFVREQYTPTLDTLYGRMITRGAAGNEKELLKVGNIWDWYLNTSTETVVLAYKETSNSTWKARVFDLNLNFLYEIDTQKTYDWTTNYYGKINQHVFNNNINGTPWTIYNFNKLLNVKAIDYPISNLTTRFNTSAY